MHTDAPSKPRLVLHNLFNFGHFLVYASVFTRWGLSRGFEVHMFGRGLGATAYGRRFAGHPGVVLHDANPGENLDPLRADWAKPALLRESLDALLAAQRELAPRASVLLATDDFLFEGVGITDPDFRFETPTFGLTTFGHREQYTGYADAHARALARMIENRSPFSAIFTLDEHHARDTGADPDFLVFMPDIFAEDMPGESSPAGDLPEDQELARFLAAGTGPVFPVIGKFDRRKNNLWVLEAASAVPDASCVVLGERVPCQDDERIDALLDGLHEKGRLFERRGFVPEGLFHAVLAHQRTPFLALPYSCHYGSSGIQLLGLAHGKPSLAPSGGLMARRVQDHGLGLVFRAGGRTDFEQCFKTLLNLGPSPFRERCAGFMACFSPDARHAQLDRALGVAPRKPSPEDVLNSGASAGDESPHEAMRLFWKGKAAEALDRLGEFSAQAPQDPGLVFRTVMLLFGMGRIQKAREAAGRCIELGAAEEFDFFVRQQVQAAQALLAAGDRDGAAGHVDRVLQLAPAASLPGKGEEVFSAPTWRQIGSVLAQAGVHGRAVDCFRAAMRLDPGAHDIRLNISDALRYAGRFEESLRELETLESAAPGWPGLAHKRGQVLFEMGKERDALAFFLAEPADSPHRQAAMAYAERIGDAMKSRGGRNTNP